MRDRDRVLCWLVRDRGRVLCWLVRDRGRVLCWLMRVKALGGHSVQPFEDLNTMT